VAEQNWWRKIMVQLLSVQFSSAWSPYTAVEHVKVKEQGKHNGFWPTVEPFQAER